jgi:hypothetical protein
MEDYRITAHKFQHSLEKYFPESEDCDGKLSYFEVNMVITLHLAEKAELQEWLPLAL